MAAVISSNTLGLYHSSLSQTGQGGSGQIGSQGNQVYVNSATGNLIVQQQDELLKSLGIDQQLIRTYNSQGQFSDDNGDNWQLNVHQKIEGLSGTINTAGSTISKTHGDGSEHTYTYDSVSGNYISTDGSGAHDTLNYNASTDKWTWTDGSTNISETYNGVTGYIETHTDNDGLISSYSYTGSLLTSMTDGSGQTTHFDYIGNNLTQIRTISNGVAQTRVQYSYDNEDRLTTVTVDLSPADNDISDNNTFVTSYTYDSTSKRLASITSGDTPALSITYINDNGDFKVGTLTDGEGNITRFDYSTPTAVVTQTNPAGLTSTEDTTTNTDYSLNTALLTGSQSLPDYYVVQSSDTWASIALTLYGSSDVATALAASQGNVTLSSGVQLSGLATSLSYTDTTTSTVPAYYVIQSGDSWDSIAQAIYGDSAAGSYLSAVLNTPALTAGNHLTIPDTLNVGTAQGYDADLSVLTSTQGATSYALINSELSSGAQAYYQVQNGDTWVSIASDLYGDASLALLLQTSLGDVTLIGGRQLVMPASINYTPVDVTVLNHDVSYFQSGLNVDYYDGSVVGSTVDNIPTTSPTQSSLVTDFNVNGLLTALGEDVDYFGLRYSSNLTITTAGDYTFSTRSDDGSKLYIDGLEVVNNDGAHAARTVYGDIYLSAGSHRIVVEFFEHQGGELLEVTYQGTDTSDVAVDLATAGALQIESGSVPADYSIQAGDTWVSIATAIYGDAAAAAALEAALGSPSLTVGDSLSLPSSITYTPADQTATVDSSGFITPSSDSYYLVQHGDTWESIATTLYGSAEAVNDFRLALGNIDLHYGLQLTAIPDEVMGTDIAEFQVMTGGSNQLTDAVVTALTGGDYLVVWTQNYDIKAQRYNAEDERVGDEFRVNSHTSNVQKEADVTLLADGGFVVTWQSAGQDGSDYGIYAQRYDVDSVAVGSEFQVNTYTNSTQSIPVITSLANGGFVVVWESNGQDGSDYGIYGQRYDALGAADGNEFLVNSYTVNQQRIPRVTSLAAGGFVVTWQSNLQTYVTTEGVTATYSNDDIFGQRFDELGAPVGDEFHVNTGTGGYQIGSGLTQLDDGSMVVIWKSNHSGEYNIYGQRYDVAGNVLGGEFQVNSTLAGEQLNIDVTALADGGFVAVWQSKGQDGFGDSIVGQRFNAAGDKVDGEFIVNDYVFEDQQSPSVTGLADGSFVVAWQSENQNSDGFSVYARHYATPSQVGLAYDYYDGSPAGGTVENIADSNPDYSGIATDFDLTGLISSLGENLDNFAMRYQGDIDITTADTYTFTLRSDDGSRLLIDGIEIINHDGPHNSNVTLNNDIALTAGKHSIVIEFFENTGNEVLDIKYKGADTGGVLTDIMSAGVLSTAVTVTDTHYAIQAGDTWESIAALVYGDAQLGQTLQQALGSPDLTVGNSLSLPLNLALEYTVTANASGLLTSVTTTTTVDNTLDSSALNEGLDIVEHYAVQSGDTWSSIATALYGSSDVADELAANQGSIALSAGVELTNLASTLTNTVISQVAVTPYYTVSSGDTWNSIALAVYGDNSDTVANALKAHHGEPVLTDGLQLEVPLNLTVSASSANVTQVTDALGHTTDYHYDSDGQLTNIVSPDVANGDGRLSTQYRYDSDGNVSSVTDGNGHRVTYQYDANGNLVQQQDSLGNTVTYTYSAPASVEHVGLLVDYYDGKPAGDTVDAIATSDPNYSGIATDFDITGLMTGLNEDLDKFGLRYSGDIEITTADTYTFTLRSDDGSKLFIDGVEIIDHDGRHNSSVTLSYDIALTAGKHQIVIAFFEDTSAEILDVRYSGADTGDVLTDIMSSGALSVTTAAVLGQPSQLLTETSYQTPDLDMSNTLNEASGAQTNRYIYDSEGHLRFTVSAEGRVSESRYDVAGNNVSSHTYLADRYDISALSSTDVLTQAQLTTWLSSIDQSQSSRSDYSYDFRGNVSSSTVYASIDSAGEGIIDGLQSTTTYVYDQAGQLLQTVDANGSATTGDLSDGITSFSYDGLGRLLTATNALGQSSLTAYDDANNRITTTSANGLATTQVFDGRGHLTSISQADGAIPLGTTTNSYDDAGRLHSTTDVLGNTSTFTYDDANRLIATVDANGGVSRLIYDKAGNIIETVAYVTVLDASQLAAVAAGTGTIDFDALANAGQDRHNYVIYDEANRAVISIDAMGFVTQSVYDGEGQLTQVHGYANAITLPSTLTQDNVLAAINLSSVNDRHTQHAYSADGQLIASLDGENYLTTFSYDDGGRLVSSTRYATQATDINTLPVTHADDQTSHTFYTNRNQLIASLDAAGYLAEYSYDLNGNQIDSTVYYTKATNYTGSETLTQLRPTAHANDAITVTTYDALNRVSTISTQTDSATHIVQTLSQFTYDIAGNLIKTELGLNDATQLRTSQARYDIQNRLTQTLSAQGSELLADWLTANPTATQTEIDTQTDLIWSQYGSSHTYNLAGQRISTTNALGHTSTVYYNDLGQKSYQVNANGEVIKYDYSTFDQVSYLTQYTGTIDTTGLIGGNITTELSNRITAIADSAIDNQTEQRFNLRGEISRILDSNRKSVITSYTAFGEVSMINSQHNGLNNTTNDYALDRYYYDRRGLLTSTIQDYDSQGLNRSGSLQRDAFGRTIQSTDGNGNVSEFSYDKRGQVITSTDALNQNTSQTYDAFGRVLTQTDGNGHTFTTTYDDANHSITLMTAEGISTSTTQNLHGETIIVTDGNGHDTTYDYDVNGNLISVTDALGNDSTTNYNAINQVTITTDAKGTDTHFSYDAVGRTLSRTLDPTGLNITTQYSYDGQGRTVTMTDANGIETHSEYDEVGNIIATIIDPAGLNLRTEYDYDARGNTVLMIEAAGTAQARTTEYVYDHLGRRSSTTQDPAGLNLTTTYSFDDNDNVISMTQAAGTVQASTTQFVYDELSRMHYQINALGQVSESNYDAVNNLTRQVIYATAINLNSLTSTPTLSDIANLVSQSIILNIDNEANTLYNLPVQAYGYVDSANNKEPVLDSSNITIDTSQNYIIDPALTLGNITTKVTSFNVDVMTESVLYKYKSGQTAVNANRSEDTSILVTWDAQDSIIAGSQIKIVLEGLTWEGTATTQSHTEAATSNFVRITTGNNLGQYNFSTTHSVAVTTTNASGGTTTTYQNQTINYSGDSTGIVDVTGVKIYKVTSDGDELLTTKNLDGGIHNLDVSGLVFSGQPNSVTSINFSYWPANDPAAILQKTVDIIDGKAVILANEFIAGDYLFEAAFFDSANNLINHLSGSFTQEEGAVNNALAMLTPSASNTAASVIGSIGTQGGDFVVDITTSSVAYYYKSSSSTAATTSRADDTQIQINWNSQEATVAGSEIKIVLDGTTWEGTATTQSYTAAAGATSVILTTGNNSGQYNFSIVTRVLFTPPNNMPGGGWRNVTSTYSANSTGIVDVSGITIYKITADGDKLLTSKAVTGGAHNLTTNVLLFKDQPTDTHSVELKYWPINDGNAVSTKTVNVSSGKAAFLASEFAAGDYAYEAAFYDSNNALVNHVNGSFTQADDAISNETINQTTITGTSLTWSNFIAPANTDSVEFNYRIAGSNDTWTALAVTETDDKHHVLFDNSSNGSYEYVINYRDVTGSVLKTTTDQYTINGIGSNTYVVSFERAMGGETAGSSIMGYISNTEAATIDYIEAKVYLMGTGTQLGTTALTYPRFQDDTDVNVNLSTGAPLSDNGQYDVVLTKHFKDGSASVTETIYYEVGPQAYAARISVLSWNNGGQPANTSAHFFYALAGSDNFTEVAPSFDSNTNSYQVSFDDLNGNYDYHIEYRDDNGVMVAKVSDTFTITSDTDDSQIVSELRNKNTLNHQVYNAYDADNRLIYQVDAQGYVTELSYDNNNVIKRTHYELKLDTGEINFNSTSLVSSLAADIVAHSGDRIQHHVYDTAGRAVYDIDALGYVSEYRYDALGQVNHTIRHHEAITVSSEPTLSEVAAALSADSNSDLDHRSYLFYDSAGRVGYEVDSLGGITRNFYNPRGEITERMVYQTPITMTANLTAADVYDFLPHTIETHTSATGVIGTQAYYRSPFQAYGYVESTGGETITIGSSLSGYMSDAEAAQIDSVTAAVYIAGTDTQVGSTVTTSLAAQNNTDIHINLAVGNVLADGQYDVILTTHFTNGSSERIESTYLEVGQQAYYLTESTFSWEDIDQPASTSPTFYYALIGSSEFISVTPSFNAATNHYSVTFDEVASGEHYVYRIIYMDDQGNSRYLMSDQVVINAGSVEGMGAFIDSRENPTKTSHVDYDALGRTLADVAAYGSSDETTTTYGYDALGNQTSMTDGRGNRDGANAADYTTTYAYDVLGQKVSATDGGHAGKATSYDVFGNITSVTDANGQTGYFYYNELNQLILQVDPEGYASRSEYDAFGNITHTVKFAHQLTPGYDVTTSLAQLHSHHLVEDSLLDQVNLASYNKLNQNIQITDTYNNTQHYSYNAFGQVVSDTDKNGNVTQFSYDLQGRQVTETLAMTINGQAISNQHIYDAFGNIIERTEAVGLAEQRVTQYGYDNNNRLVETIEPNVMTYGYVSSNDVGKVSANLSFTLGVSTKTHSWRASRSTTGISSQTTYYTATKIDDTVLSISWGDNENAFAGGQFKIIAKGLSWSGVALSQSQVVTAGDSSTTLTLGNNSLSSTGIVDLQSVEIYRVTNDGDVLIGIQALTAGSKTLTLNQVSFANQPADAVSMHVSYWPLSDEHDVYQFDGVVEGGSSILPAAAIAADGSYTYHATFYDANSQIVNELDGRFTKQGGKISNVQITGNTVLQAQNDTPHTSLVYDTQGNLIRETSGNGDHTYHYYDNQNRRVASVDGAGYLTVSSYDAVGNTLSQRTYNEVMVASTQHSLAQLMEVMTDLSYREVTFSYDAANRLVSSQTQHVLTYQHDSGATVQQLENMTDYDKAGNIVKSTDANGHSQYFFYDKVNNQIAHVDALGYVTARGYDGQGNLIEQTRFASALSSATLTSLTADSDDSVLIAQVQAANNADDRSTAFEYDRLNRLVRQHTDNVTYQNFDNGTLTSTSDRLTQQFEYDAVGNIISTTQAGGDVTQYQYDALNRQTLETKAGDMGAQQRTQSVYDGLGNVTQEVRLGTNDAISSDDHTTTFIYDDHGNIITQTDAEGHISQYYYDLNSNLVLMHEGRENPDGLLAPIDTRYEYDALNRQISTEDADGFRQFVRYNAQGDITAKGLNGIEQEYFDYDAAGRLVKTNQQDGVDKAYLYDANGNATAKFVSMDADNQLNIRTADLMSLATSNSALLQHTETQYDARNQQIGIYESPISFQTSEQIGTEQVWLDVKGDVFAGGVVGISGGDSSLSVSSMRHNWQVTTTTTGLCGSTTSTASYSKDDDTSLTVSWPDLDEIYGDGDIKVVAYGLSWSGEATSNTEIVSSGNTSATVTLGNNSLTGHQTGTTFVAGTGPSGIGVNTPTYSGPLGVVDYTHIEVYKVTPQGDILVATGTDSLELTEQLHISRQPQDAETVELWLWPDGASQPASPVILSKYTLPNSNEVDGWFAFDWSGLDAGSYQYEFKAMDSEGNELNHVRGDLVLGDSPQLISQEQLVTRPVFSDTGEVTNTIHRQVAYNAFGEVVAEVDGRASQLIGSDSVWAMETRAALGYVVDVNAQPPVAISYVNLTEQQQAELQALYTTGFEYDVQGNLVRKTDAQVATTKGDGSTIQHSPVTEYYYDINGRALATQDANSLLYGRNDYNQNVYDAAGNIVIEVHADGGSRHYSYDVFGNRTSLTNELGQITTYQYNQLNQLTRMDLPTDSSFNNVTRFETFDYDLHGRRISRTNANGNTEKTYYDDVGRVIRNVDFGGIDTEYRYSYNMGTGGITKTTTLADGKTMVDTLGYFGQLISHQDLGGHSFTYHYNDAGLLAHQEGSTGQSIDYAYYNNGLLKEINDSGVDSRTIYQYDANGNRIGESYMTSTDGAGRVYYQVSTAEYDALNRLVSVNDANFDLSYRYDANNNRINTHADYYDLATPLTQDYWYSYDEMNRFVVTKGELNNGVIEAGSTGYQIGYDLAGQRRLANQFDATGALKSQESYDYNSAGLLTLTTVNDYANNKTYLANRQVYDAVGNLINYTEHQGDLGSATSLIRSNDYTYNANHRQTQDINNYQGSTSTTQTHYDVNGDVSYTRKVQANTVETTWYQYDYWDSAKQSQIKVSGDVTTYSELYSWKSGFSHFSYDANGHLTQLVDEEYANGAGRQLKYETAHDGRILQRAELLGNASSANRNQQYFYFNDTPIGDSGTFGATQVDYAAALAQRGGASSSGSNSSLPNDEQKSLRYGYYNYLEGNANTAINNLDTRFTTNFNGQTIARPVQSTEFDTSYTPISDSYPSNTPNSYTLVVQDIIANDMVQTLKNVALKVWGDASLWYVIADANGFHAAQSQPLAAGQNIVIPNTVSNVHHNASTFKIYEPGQQLGNVNPTLPEAPPQPPIKEKSGGCGGLLSIIVIIVIVVVTRNVALAMQAAGGFSTTAIAVGSAVAGSVAGQVAGNILGIQDGFDFGAIATAALTAGIGAQFGVGGLGGKVAGTVAESGGIASDIITGAVNNAASQGIRLLTGQQEKFDWKGVAVAAISAPIMNLISDTILGNRVTLQDGSVGRNSTNFARNNAFAADVVNGIATGVAHNAIDIVVRGGGRIDWSGIAINAIGNAAGNAINRAIEAANTRAEYQPVSPNSVTNFEAGTKETAYHRGQRNYLPTRPNSAIRAAGPQETAYHRGLSDVRAAVVSNNVVQQNQYYDVSEFGLTAGINLENVSAAYGSGTGFRIMGNSADINYQGDISITALREDIDFTDSFAEQSGPWWKNIELSARPRDTVNYDYGAGLLMMEIPFLVSAKQNLIDFNFSRVSDETGLTDMLSILATHWAIDTLVPTTVLDVGLELAGGSVLKAADKFNVSNKIDFPEISVVTKINGNAVTGVAKPIDVRLGAPNKVTIIGRSMDAVEPYADALRAKGIDVNVFSSADFTVPTYARKQWDMLRSQYNGRIPNDILPETQMFKANEGWAELIKHDNSTVINIGNPFNQGDSVFFNMEQQLIFGK